MQIFIKGLKGEFHTIDVDGLHESIYSVKEKIEKITEQSPDQQKLIFKGKILKDKRALVDYGIENEDILHLVLRVKGGGFVGNEAVVEYYIDGFGDRLKEFKGAIEEEKLDSGYYLAQSGHNIGLSYEVYDVKFWIDERLDEDWIKIF